MPLQENTPDTLVSELVDEDMRDLVEMFVAELPDKVAAIEEAIDAQDISAAGRLAHQLKGAAGGYGFPSITDAARVVESSAKTGENVETLAQQTRTLADLCGRARAPKA